jgi:superfamily II DNA or RNA helicase
MKESTFPPDRSRCRSYVCLPAMNAERPAGIFEELFARHRTATVPDLWPWQREILAAYEDVRGDVAIDLPTGTGKTLLGLLIGEEYRQRTGSPGSVSRRE